MTSTATPALFVNTDTDAAYDMVERIVDAIANGWTVTIDGTPVFAPYGAHNAAKVWQNGSISVDVRTKTGNRATERWIKAGASAEFTFTR